MHERTTKVFAKAALDKVTSAKCKQQQYFGQTNFDLAFSCQFQQYIFNCAFVPGWTSNESLPSQILERQTVKKLSSA